MADGNAADTNATLGDAVGDADTNIAAVAGGGGGTSADGGPDSLDVSNKDPSGGVEPEHEDGGDVIVLTTTVSELNLDDKVKVPVSTIDISTEEGRLLQARIKAAFNVFDHDGNNTCDVREIGTIIRSLGVCPTEAQLFDLITEIEEDEPTGFVVYHKFEVIAARCLKDNVHPAYKKEQILNAFKVLDRDNLGHFTQEDFSKIMTEEGEPFSTEEVEEMMTSAVDQERGIVSFEDYAEVLTATS